jgi:hypothetical protein
LSDIEEEKATERHLLISSSEDNPLIQQEIMRNQMKPSDLLKMSSKYDRDKLNASSKNNSQGSSS